MIPDEPVLKAIASALLLFLVGTDCRAAENMGQVRIPIASPPKLSSGVSARGSSSVSPDALAQGTVLLEDRDSQGLAGLGTRQGRGNLVFAEGENVASSFPSGHASTPEIPQGQEMIPIRTQEFQNAQSSAPRKPYNSLAGGDSTEVLSGGPDTPWKRKARLQGIRMRMLQGPEALYHGSFISSDSEYGSRHVAGAVMPLNERWELSALNHVSVFSVRQENQGAGRESMHLRVGMGPGKSFRPWFSLAPYINFGDARGERASIATGMSKNWKDGTHLAAEVYAWRPWDEGYHTMIEDGHRHGGTLAFTLPVTRQLTFSTRAHYEELALGSKAKSGAQYAGSRYGWNARAYYRLLQREAAFMGHGFRSDDLWNEYLVGSELGVFMHLDWQRYEKPERFTALYPVPEAFGQQLGFSYQHAFSPHLGLTAESYIGRDPDRHLRFGDVLGVNMRLTMLMDPQFRVWGALGYVKSNTTLESNGNSENTVSLGINYHF